MCMGLMSCGVPIKAKDDHKKDDDQEQVVQNKKDDERIDVEWNQESGKEKRKDPPMWVALGLGGLAIVGAAWRIYRWRTAHKE